MSVQRAASAVVAAIVAAVLLAGCSTGAPMSDATESSRPPFLTTAAPTPSAAPIELSAARRDAIVADLAARGVVDPPDVVSADAVQWPNGALGCPTPGTSYIQQLIDGAKVVVRADGRDWDYRFGAGDTPTLCER